MTTKIQKWGNSLAVRLPKEIIQRLSLREGGSVVVRADKETIVIHKQKASDHLKGKNDWKRYMLPSGRTHKKENVSGMVDALVYGNTR